MPVHAIPASARSGSLRPAFVAEPAAPSGPVRRAFGLITVGARRLAALALGLGGLVGLLAPAHAAEPHRLVATTAMVADLVQQVGGDRVQVRALMGPGVDPHLYKPTPADVVALQQAVAIFYNGLHLEGKMTEVLERIARRKPVVALADEFPAARILTEADGGTADPHVWFDVALWAEGVTPILAALEKLDPAGADDYRARAAATRERLATLHTWALARAQELPRERRVLVTSHDAFNYFGRAYGFEVVGLQGLSTVSEASLADVAKLVDFIKQRGLRAIFVESSVSHATIERVAQDAGVKIGGELFSDAMGVPGQVENGYDLGTYDGMVRHNVNAIVEALK